MNLFDFALKMEREGKAYYEKLAAETPLTGLTNIFLRLAKDEQKHYDTVTKLKMGANPSMTDTTVLDRAQNVFQELLSQRSAVDAMQRDLDGYAHAMKVEADSVRFYEEMAGKEPREATARLLQRIADEEKKHYNIMENLYDFVLAPQNFLAWAEFSNLKQL